MEKVNQLFKQLLEFNSINLFYKLKNLVLSRIIDHHVKVYKNKNCYYNNSYLNLVLLNSKMIKDIIAHQELRDKEKIK